MVNRLFPLKSFVPCLFLTLRARNVFLGFGGLGMAIQRQIKPRYATRNEQIVARIRAEAGADAPIDPHMRVKKRVAEVAYLMALIHGGDWRVRVDHHEGVVMIARRGRRQTL